MTHFFPFPGYYCTYGSNSSTPTLGDQADECPSGHYCPEGSSRPSPCPPGSYNAGTRLQKISDCSNCTGGRYCPEWNMTAPGPLCQQGMLFFILTLMLLVANLANTKWWKNNWKTLETCHVGTHLRELRESFPMNTNMTGFRWFSKNFVFSSLDESSLIMERVKKSLCKGGLFVYYLDNQASWLFCTLLCIWYFTDILYSYTACI